MISAPASCRSFTTVASNGDVKSVAELLAQSSITEHDVLLVNIAEEHVVGMNFVRMLSLTATVTPESGSNFVGVSSCS